MALGSLSAGAAVVHFAVAPDHFRQGLRFGAFFVVVATLQLASGAAIATRPSRTLYASAAIGNALVLAVWAVSRTTGLPIGPDAGIAEPIGAVDGLATLYEVILVAGSLYMLARGPGDVFEERMPARLGWPSAVAVYVLPALAVAFGGHGHGPATVPHVDAHLVGHHFFHLVFIGAASLIFLVYVAFLVIENGRPTFSWRIRPDSGPR